ncbi:hypothetical protein MKW94_024607, partial [Papaver nudicaule]|nr:hypothetical protein [Papaver nudicaule]
GNDLIECDSNTSFVLVAVCSSFVKNYQEKKSRAPFYIDPDNRNEIHLTRSGFDHINIFCIQAANVIMCNATATNLLLHSGWYYQACPRCNKKVAGDSDDLWCTKCETKVVMQVSRFLVRFEVRDHTDNTIFVALDGEVQKLVPSNRNRENVKELVMTGFSQLLNQSMDYKVRINSFNMKQKSPTSFTVTRMYLREHRES